MSARIWNSVSVAVQSALATAVTISGISKASPGVVSHSGTDPSNGDFVVLKVNGMYEVNERVFRVANQAAGTFELEGEDTTNYGTFTSGTFEVITFGTSLGTIRSVSGSGGEYDFIDVTTIHDAIRSEIPGLASPATFSLESRWEPDDTGLIALQSASKQKAQRAVKMTFSGGSISTFFGYVGASGIPGGSAQDLVTTPVVLTASGVPTNYAS